MQWRRFNFCCHQHVEMTRRQQYTRQHGDAPLIKLLDVDRGYQVLAIVDQGLAREKAGRMRVRSHALVDDIEVREFSRRQREEFTDVLVVQSGGNVWSKFSLNAVHVPAGKMSRIDEVFFGQLEIALSISGGHAALIDPK